MELHQQRIVIRRAGHQYRRLYDPKIAIKHKVQRAAKSLTAVIVGEAHFAQRHLTGKVIQGIDTFAALKSPAMITGPRWLAICSPIGPSCLL